MYRFYFVILINLFRIPYLVPKMSYMARHSDRYSEERRYELVRKIVRIIKRSAAIFTKSFGVENLPREGGYIMFANHQGKYDALGIFHTHLEPCSVVMDEARSHMPVASQVLDLVEGKRLKKDDIRQSMKIIMEMAEEAAEGRKFIIFPEGGYFHNKNTVQEFKPGSFKSAVKAKVPIVPVALVDSYKAFEGFRVGPIRTQVHYLPPIPYEAYKDMKTTEISELVRKQIMDKIEEVLEKRRKNTSFR